VNHFASPMNNNNNRGRGAAQGGRGRGGGNPPRTAVTQQSLSAQLRQLERLQEPEEVKLLRKFAPIGAFQIRSTYGASGLSSREIGILNGSTVKWISLNEGEINLAGHQVSQQLDIYNGRIHTRLTGTSPLPVDYAHASAEQQRILRMSQTEYNRFRGPATQELVHGAVSEETA